jgi:hypothetical protein
MNRMHIAVPITVLRHVPPQFHVSGMDNWIELAAGPSTDPSLDTDLHWLDWTLS